MEVKEGGGGWAEGRRTLERERERERWKRKTSNSRHRKGRTRFHSPELRYTTRYNQAKLGKKKKNDPLLRRVFFSDRFRVLGDPLKKPFTLPLRQARGPSFSLVLCDCLGGPTSHRNIRVLSRCDNL